CTDAPVAPLYFHLKKPSRADLARLHQPGEADAVIAVIVRQSGPARRCRRASLGREAGGPAGSNRGRCHARRAQKFPSAQSFRIHLIGSFTRRAAFLPIRECCPESPAETEGVPGSRSVCPRRRSALRLADHSSKRPKS